MSLISLHSPLLPLCISVSHSLFLPHQTPSNSTPTPTPSPRRRPNYIPNSLATRQARHRHNRGRLPRHLQRRFRGHEDHCQGGWQCCQCRWVPSSQLWPLSVICNGVRWYGCGVLICGSGFWVVVV